MSLVTTFAKDYFVKCNIVNQYLKIV